MKKEEEHKAEELPAEEFPSAAAPPPLGEEDKLMADHTKHSLKRGDLRHAAPPRDPSPPCRPSHQPITPRIAPGAVHVYHGQSQPDTDPAPVAEIPNTETFHLVDVQRVEDGDNSNLPPLAVTERLVTTPTNGLQRCPRILIGVGLLVLLALTATVAVLATTPRQSSSSTPYVAALSPSSSPAVVNSGPATATSDQPSSSPSDMPNSSLPSGIPSGVPSRHVSRFPLFHPTLQSPQLLAVFRLDLSSLQTLQVRGHNRCVLVLLERLDTFYKVSAARTTSGVQPQPLLVQ